jgi:glycosyltransferase involved in cell wall biosynthesis
MTGRGSLAAQLTEAIADRGLQDVVRFEGWVSRELLAGILRSADAGIVAHLQDQGRELCCVTRPACARARGARSSAPA